MPRARFPVLLLTLACLHAALDARPVFAQSPPAPTLTSATSDGTFVILQWTRLPDARLSYRVEAGSAPGLSDLVVINAGGFVSEFRAFGVPPGAYYSRRSGCRGATPPRPRSDVTNFTAARFQGVPFGTYYVRVREIRNGVAGAASNEVTLPVVCAAPPAIVDARATVVGNGVQFTWNYAQASAADFGLMLEAGSAPGAADLAAVPVPRLASTGLNAFAAAGTYFTRLRAANACGVTVSSEIPVTLTGACPVPGYIPFVDATLEDNGLLSMEWRRVAEGGLESSYRVEIGSRRRRAAPAASTCRGTSARRWLDGVYRCAGMARRKALWPPTTSWRSARPPTPATCSRRW